MPEHRTVTPAGGLRRANAETVLRYALGVDVFSASDAIDATGLTRSTVIGLCDELASLGWLTEAGQDRGTPLGKGRPARLFALDARRGVVAGIDAGQHNVTVAVADLRGRTLARTHRTFDGDGLDPEHRVAMTDAALADALAEAGTGSDAVLTTVVGIPAPTDETGHSPAGHAGYWSRMNPELGTALSGHGRVVVENDANLAAVAESTIGRGRGTASFAALLAGERFGAGLMVDGSLLHGRHGGAGEMRMLEFVEGVGDASGLAALARAWGEEAREAGLPRGSALARRPERAVTAEEVFEAAAGGDPAALDICSRLGDRLARVCLVLSSLLDVERVVVVGAIASAAGPVIDRAREALGSYYPPVPEIVPSELGADAVVVGGIRRGLELVRANPLDFRLATAT
ncbi:ROK family protein [Frondihabitans australicus]|uniref:Putative NBD/HSP70 family sugar kinase n=1 Tax=Frondihabitans australicus TaxID=386892 RepID=A0A495IHV2_9MICO|nr:ROK family protein [Frondihabitans australicus]RKR74998.1 putative NBD/HSP70 family sugar kinase [Frondihabitans australicus]